MPGLGGVRVLARCRARCGARDALTLLDAAPGTTPAGAPGQTYARKNGITLKEDVIIIDVASIVPESAGGGLPWRHEVDKRRQKPLAHMRTAAALAPAGKPVTSTLAACESYCSITLGWGLLAAAVASITTQPAAVTLAALLERLRTLSPSPDALAACCTRAPPHTRAPPPHPHPTSTAAPRTTTASRQRAAAPAASATPKPTLRVGASPALLRALLLGCTAARPEPSVALAHSPLTPHPHTHTRLPCSRSAQEPRHD